MPWHADNDVWTACPWCGDDLSRDHMIWNCRGLSRKRQDLLRGIGTDRFGDVNWLVSRFGTRLGRFIQVARRLIEIVGVDVDHE